jgi:DNA-binding NarL/FixJ family response regulator/class 3 adenylate cyclase
LGQERALVRLPLAPDQLRLGIVDRRPSQLTARDSGPRRRQMVALEEIVQMWGDKRSSCACMSELWLRVPPDSYCRRFARTAPLAHNVSVVERITVVLADDNLIAREGVRSLLELEDDLEVVGVAADYDQLVADAERLAPHAVVTDIRMPPNFQREGIDAAKEIRKRHPGTGIVILSQYDDPQYAVSLLSDGAAGFAYLLKDRIAEGDQLARAIREVTTGGSLIDPRIVEALVTPLRDDSLTPSEEDLLRQIAEGRHIKAIAVSERTTPEAVSDAVERLFRKLADEAGRGDERALQRLRMLHRAIVEREEQGERLSRLLPEGLADEVRSGGRRIGETDLLEVTVLMSDVRGYSAIAERADPSVLARQLNAHRAEMNAAIVANGGTVMQFVGDAVMGVFGAPMRRDDHAGSAVAAASAMHERQALLNERWATEGLPPFHLGIGLSTGSVAAALLGSEERLEYSLVGDSVNLTQRLQQLADEGETVLSQATLDALPTPVDVEPLEPTRVKGREATVQAYRVVARPARAASTPAAVRVLVVDDQRPFRDAAKSVVEVTAGFEVVGEAESGERAVELAATLAPDLVLMDVNLPDIDGLEATRRILAASPGRIVLALSTESGLATRAVATGAAAFIPKSEFDPDRLAEAWAAAHG